MGVGVGGGGGKRWSPGNVMGVGRDKKSWNMIVEFVFRNSGVNPAYRPILKCKKLGREFTNYYL